MRHVPASRVDRRVVLLGLAGAPGLGGCSSILPMPPTPQLYLLRPPITHTPGERVPWRLSVAVPDAPESLDTVRVALTRPSAMMDYFANAAWNERVPLLFQRLLIEDLDASGRILSVSRDTSGYENDYLLATEIRDFQARYDAMPSVPKIVIGIQAKLVRMPQRDIVATVSVGQEDAAESNNLDAIVAAFNRATGAAIGQITAWTLNTSKD